MGFETASISWVPMRDEQDHLKASIRERKRDELLRLIDLYKGKGCWKEEWSGSLLLEALRSEFVPAIKLFLATEGIIRRPVKELRFPLDQKTEVDGTIIQNALLRIYEDENFDWLDLLFEAGMSVEARIDEHGRTLLMAAAWHNLDLAAQLLGRGAEINSQDHDGNTALMYACMTDIAFLTARESEEMVRLLLHAGADRWMTNLEGKTALEILKNQVVDEETEPVRKLLADYSS